MGVVRVSPAIEGLQLLVDVAGKLITWSLTAVTVVEYNADIAAIVCCTTCINVFLQDARRLFVDPHM